MSLSQPTTVEDEESCTLNLSGSGSTSHSQEKIFSSRLETSFVQKNSSNSRRNFASKLASILFTSKERMKAKCGGKRGKKTLDQEKITFTKINFARQKVKKMSRETGKIVREL